MTRKRGKFPIGAKLVLIISILLIVSLGAITALVSILISSDVRITAEDNNFTVNAWAADGAERALRAVLAKAVLLLNDRGAGRPGEEAGQGTVTDADFFFSQNKDIAVVALNTSRIFLNDAFFRSRKIDPARAEAWLKEQQSSFFRADSGQIILRNAGAFFSEPLLAVFFPTSLGGAAAIFSPREISRNFLDTGNVTFLINEMGDVLIHPDESLSQENLASLSFVRKAIESKERSLQTMYTENDGEEYLGAFERLFTDNAIVVTTIPSSMIFAGIRKVTQRNVAISAVILALSIIVIVIFSGTISRPIQALIRATGQIEEGDYNLALKARNRDEIGVLTQTFIGMGHGLENFEKFTNKAIVRQAREGRLTRAGTSRDITVCFAQIRNFKEVAADMDTEDTITFVNLVLSRIVPCVTTTGGVVDKFLTQEGVVVMALWGALESGRTPEEDAFACVTSALMMRDAIRTLNAERRKAASGNALAQRPLIKLGCGINSGEVIAGQIGSEDRMEYTVIGDMVNLASRIEEPNNLFDTDILVTENVTELTGGAIITEEMTTLTVKGKEEPLRIFAVVNRRGRAGPATMAEVRRYWG
jgi:adenylate cyclase